MEDDPWACVAAQSASSSAAIHDTDAAAPREIAPDDGNAATRPFSDETPQIQRQILLQDRFCSVLNVVIDHSMEDPTSLEPMELNLNHSPAAGSAHPHQTMANESTQEHTPTPQPTAPIKVPVIRIFGPLHRGANARTPPKQSACLYIHGAYPYLLARPRAAGPDGSYLGRPCSGHVDWDCSESVQDVAHKLGDTLESALQSMDADDSNSKRKKTANRIIRQVSVVCGRGFYTFCPGPPAPFLRIEYYDPKLRWKIKWMLEKGIEVPMSFHPDPHQYAHDATELLRFHCYEAHIPYTMQFFKDWNLAGMSYIHLKGATLRGPLPTNIKRIIPSTRPIKQNAVDPATAATCFLEANTSREHMWESTPRRTDHVTQPRIPPKRTSCDIELDCTVHDILNVDEVITEMPSQDRDEIQWRAVPSLRTIWRQERQRMARLLPPQHDFLRRSDASCFTLKESRSGTQLATRGMRNLIAATPGLQDEFDRSLQQIVERHRFAGQSKGKAVPTTKQVNSEILTSTSKPEANEHKTFKTKSLACLPCLTPTVEETMETLGALGDQFEIPANRQIGSPSSRTNHRSQDERESVVSGLHLATSQSTTQSIETIALDDGDEDTSINQQQEQQQQQLDSDPEIYSQRIDRGDKVVSSQLEDIEELIDPETLLPFETIFLGTDHCRAIVAHPETTETIKVCGGPADSCSHLHRAASKAKPGFYKTVSDGFRVDGILEHGSRKGSQEDHGGNTHPHSHPSAIRHGQDDDHDNDDENELDVQAFEGMLSNLATQMEHDDEGKHTLRMETEMTQTMDQSNHVLPQTQNLRADPLLDPHQSSEEDGDDESIPGSASDDGATSILHVATSMHTSVKTPAKTRQDNTCNRDGTTPNHDDLRAVQASKLPWRGYGRFVPTSCPPVRSKGGANGSMPPTHHDRDERNRHENTEADHRLASPAHVRTYLMDRSENTNPRTARNGEHWQQPTIPKDGAYVGTTSLPPTRGMVNYLARRSRKRNNRGNNDNGNPKRDRDGFRCKNNANSENHRNSKKPRLARSLLPGTAASEVKTRTGIDTSDARMVVTAKPTARPAQHASVPLKNVEEVAWDSTQVPLTPSQLTQPVGDVDDQDVSYSQRIATVHNPKTTTKTSDSTFSTRPKTAASVEKAQSNEALDGGTSSHDALVGIGSIGGRIHIQGGGGLKAKTKQSQDSSSGGSAAVRPNVSSIPTPVTAMSIEIHIQCRSGESRLDARKIAMVPNPGKDRIVAIAFVFAIDPGGGEALKVLQRGLLFIPLEGDARSRQEQATQVKMSMPRISMDISSPLLIECLSDEKALLLRLASIVRMRDPDMMLSWDPQALGLGYLIERAAMLGTPDGGGDDRRGAASPDLPGIDMVRLLGRTPNAKDGRGFMTKTGLSKLQSPDDATKSPLDAQLVTHKVHNWAGSGLGGDWDERVGAGAAAASIAGRLVFAGWKIIAEEVKHPNVSYQPAVVAAVLARRIPHHDDLMLTRWYAESDGKDRWRVLNHRLIQATSTLLLFDALDIIGRAGEASRLSGVEFSQSFPGIRGSQYKVEGVLLRALQSLRSDERGAKKGVRACPPPLDGSATDPCTSGDTLTPNSPADRKKSQSQSPWKLRRGYTRNRKDEQVESDPDRNSQARQYFFFFSPSMEDTNKQEALEVQALTLEPQSAHYKEPVVVCDFTALYPSLVIAYNLCYSTCAGKLEYHSTRREMRVQGRTTGQVGPFAYPELKTATVLKDHIKSKQQSNMKGSGSKKTKHHHDRCYVSPTGSIYVGESVLKGVLPQVLDEMLTTRAMLKKASKEYKKRLPDISPAVLRQLEARQLALKYVANVTYGYTSATFSGRCAMPLLADTIVECGRKTLRRAIDLANRIGNENGRWSGCRVIYGDTDSLFVRLPGRTYKEAFQFGEELCRRVTADNPPPVQLKLEKVYVGSIMQTMKRYCGMKYESSDQRKPVFEAKGLETIRRDQCALTQKVLRNALITLFKKGIDAVRQYLNRQWALILGGYLPVSDFILTGKVRSKYRGGKEGPVQAVLARRMAEADPGRVIRHKQRLSYVIVATPGVSFRLKDCVLTPLELLERWDAYTIHSSYYIAKHVNASLQRCLGLHPHNVDVSAWYEMCAKPRRRIHYWPVSSRTRKMITSYFGSDICAMCGAKCQTQGRSKAVVCQACRVSETNTTFFANKRISSIQTAVHKLAKKCSSCNGCEEGGDSFAGVALHRSVATHRPDGSHMFGSYAEAVAAQTTATDSMSDDARLANPMANCTCLDCPATFERHRMRDLEIEAIEVCKCLELL